MVLRVLYNNDKIFIFIFNEKKFFLFKKYVNHYKVLLKQFNFY